MALINSSSDRLPLLYLVDGVLRASRSRHDLEVQRKVKTGVTTCLSALLGLVAPNGVESSPKAKRVLDDWVLTVRMATGLRVLTPRAAAVCLAVPVVVPTAGAPRAKTLLHASSNGVLIIVGDTRVSFLLRCFHGMVFAFAILS
jgi:hypothetical protein